MEILSELAAVKAACRRAARRGTLGLVPTMGALHEGHLSLVRRAASECDTVAASVFVNPLQFGPGEDFERYPRDPERDAELLASAGADLMALLAADEMYPPGFCTRVTQERLTTVLEGAARPGHFDGVLVVVAKLLLVTGCRRAYFGRKDFQQTVAVRRLVADLDIPAEAVVCPTVRDADGLALSSRNAYLSSGDRARGLSLVTALRRVETLFEEGERSIARLEGVLHDTAAEGLGLAPDYARIVDPVDLGDVRSARPGDVALIAGRCGPARLLDNHVLGEPLGPFA